jgi:hypothetical protein
LPSLPPLHFELEVNHPSSSEDNRDLSHLRRLQTTDAGEKPSLLLQLSMAKSAVTPSTTYDFKLVSLPNNKSINIDIASKLTVLANNTFKM